MGYKYLGERWTTQASWEDSPHLTEDAKESLLSSLPEWQRDARSKGIPQLGAGAIFRLPEGDYVIPPVKDGIPSHWPRCFALDVGWRWTAALWMARDPDSGTYYIYADYERQEAPPSIHAAEIKAKGAWIPGTVDPAAAGRGQDDGQKLIDNYRSLGLILTEADNSVNTGLEMLNDALVSGQLKIFDTCQRLIRQMRVYRRDEKGKIVKKYDHLCDCARYAFITGRNIMKVRPKPVGSMQPHLPSSARGWMA
jgi:hypothetical protein